MYIHAVVQRFLQALSEEKLSPASEQQRQASLKAVDVIIKKVQHSHPSVRPRVNTPGGLKKPAPPPPVVMPETTMEEEPEELYEEPPTESISVPEPEAEDYLSFEPARSGSGSGGGGEEVGEEQEMYEAMEVQEELYEQPGECGCQSNHSNLTAE